MSKPKAAAPPSRAERNILWIEAMCRVPEGKLVGQPVVLRPWQRDILRGIYDTPTRRALISFGRKNGKTGLAAFILLLHLVGPESKPNGQLFSAAQSRDQAAVLFALAAKSVRMSPDLSRYVGIRDTTKQLYCQELGTLYRALSADAHTSMGLSPTLTVFDELGQVKGPRSPLYESLETASAAHSDPLTICISTQAATDADLFSVLIDDAKTKSDPRTKLFLYTADENLDPFSEEALKQANPAYGDFQSATELKAMAEDARRMPSREAEYRNLILNQRVESISPFVAKSVWDANATAPAPSFTGQPIYIGLDLSETSDLTACVQIAKIEDKWHVKPTFWLPEEGLPDKARKDRVPWDLWASQGHLQTTPGKAIQYEFVAAYLADLFQRFDVRAVGFDRWNYRHLKPWLEQAGFDAVTLERFVEVGQGFQSQSPALRDLEATLLSQGMCHGNHPVLTMCAANSAVESDPAGNRKLSKKRSRGRIDGMVCLNMALAVANTVSQEPVFHSIWEHEFMTPPQPAPADPHPAAPDGPPQTASVPPPPSLAPARLPFIGSATKSVWDVL